jgi:nucleoid-associated protein YgaU
MNKKMVHRRRVNRTKGNIMALLFVFAMTASLFAITYRVQEVLANERDLKNTETVVYTVEKGDTLWGIAQKTGFGEDIDTRKIIDRIEKLNNLDSVNTIHPGDVLVIPHK